MKILNKNRKAFTLVEMTISVAVALVAFLLIFQFLSSTRHHFLYGTVNLQNLQEGRLAINYLRRDFSCACPRLEDPDDASYSDFQRTRKQIFATVSGVGGNAGDLIQVLPNGLLFYKFAFLPTS
ncbi:MAG: prepilin-type N-terminal cleavage/methylation domain-containing protein, partial [Candidatus Riflebacteria bacterium]